MQITVPVQSCIKLFTRENTLSVYMYFINYTHTSVALAKQCKCAQHLQQM